MKELQQIPFQLGKEYENWEFDLEPVETTQTYDKYSYVNNEPQELFGIIATQVLLTFNLDILIQVEYQFDLKYFNLLKQRLQEILPVDTADQIDGEMKWENEEVVANLIRSKIAIFKITDKKYESYLD